MLISRRFSPLELVIASAWAHPGHYQEGEALGEVLTSLEVDLLAPVTAWGSVDAVTGDYGSMWLTYGSNGTRLIGTATKGSAVVPFDTGVFDPPNPVEGIAFEQTITITNAKAQQAVVTVGLGTLLERVDFSQGIDGGVFDPADAAYNGFARGVMDTSTYTVEWK